jgi:hypothetical protein
LKGGAYFISSGAAFILYEKSGFSTAIHQGRVGIEIHISV